MPHVVHYSIMASTPLKTRCQVADAIAAVLAAKGMSGASPDTVGDVLQAWLEGARSVCLPHGLLGIAAGEVIEELERHAPGSLKE